MIDAYKRIPLMFQAQVKGRSQIQYLDPAISSDPNKQQDAQIWADQWVEAVEENVPQFSDHVQTKSYQITWRFITNSGQDEGVTRPVIGANGFPYFPGSSMKGAFLRACPQEDRIKYCGGKIGNETHPGILRFHGAYPNNLKWIDNEIVDIVHPQEKWQSQTLETHRKPRGESGFIQMSIYKPTLNFGISANKNLSEDEWQKIWQIWEKALSQGIGTRVSAGYGQVKLNREHRENVLISVSLKGQGLASTLIDKTTSEFRPNGFKAALRSHTMRLLGGVTDQATAETLTKELWGGFAGRNGAIVGQLGIAFETINLKLGNFTYSPGRNPQKMPIYKLEEGILDILAMGNLSEEQSKSLSNFLKRLIKFSLLLGGFGKSWRRVDHRLFMPEYLRNGNKPMIGCHWQVTKEQGKFYIATNELSNITNFLNTIHQKTQDWVVNNGGSLTPNGCNWRESFNQNKVQIWGRIAQNKDDSLAINWFHQNYRQNQTIKRSDLTGKLGKIGRIWHRMYPRWLKDNGKLKSTTEYVELLTIFPDNYPETRDFLNFLNSTEFERLW